MLSGYLITTLLLRERMDTGRVRMVEFWLRRARRLLPAVLVLLIVTAVVTAVSTPVVELSARRADMISTLFYFANWHFIATDASYFATFLGASPLRHMWSLAIEEQFYLLWPLALLGMLYLTRGRRGLVLVLLAVGVALSATAMAVAYSVENPSRVYFGTEAHAFPLLTGCALAVLLSVRPAMLTSGLARTLAGWSWPVVFGVLALAVFKLDDQGAFYYQGGLLAFALAVAAALWIIEVAPGSPPARVLSLRPVTWIGIISYGLYLWHWPFLVWIGAPDPRADPLSALLVVALTFVAATLSFYLVERPVRRGRMPWIRGSRRRLVLALAAMVALVGVTAAQATRIDPSEEIATQVTDTADYPCPESSPAVGGRDGARWSSPSGPVL